MSVKYTDSLEKLNSYFDAASSRTLILSPQFFRDFSCPANCGGCCPRFSLDFFDGPRWQSFISYYPNQVSDFKTRKVKGITVHTNAQFNNPGHHCMYLNHENGRCQIHKANPLSCEFELIRFVYHKQRNMAYLTKKLFGRCWQLLRVDGQRGGLCKMLPYNPGKIQRDIELIEELNDYGERLGRRTKLRPVAKFLRDNLKRLRAGQVPSKQVIF